MDSIDEKMLLFVRQNGDIPPGARRIADHDAVMHTATWVRRNVGLGTASGYAIGFESDDKWWTWIFDRLQPIAPAGPEKWKIEFYSSEGVSWERCFHYWREGRRWEKVESPEALPQALTGSR